MTGIDEVAQVVFVRKRLVEIQYLRTTITDEQREEFGALVEDTVRRIEVRPSSCPTAASAFPRIPVRVVLIIGLCLDKQELIEAALVRRPGEMTLVGLTNLRTRISAHAAEAQSQASPVRADQDRRDPGLGTEDRSGAGHPVRGTGQVSVRSAGGSVLEAGETEVV